ncbi:MAG: hypothetical protein MUP21_05255 [Dehalococcoidia bacterium]|nr:hypothetical protein [Dehalococcoidia bacterium]
MSSRISGLHVDDSIDIYHVLRAVMKRHGCDLSSAINRAQFLSEVSKPFDFIIFDGCIPGWELPEYLSDIHTFCKVSFFIYSGNSPDELEPFYQLGAEGVFEKRHGFESLCNCIYERFSATIKSPRKTADPGRARGT